MKIICSVLAAFAVLNFSVEARIGAQRSLQGDVELEMVGNNGDFDNFPLRLCQGECDSDTDVSFEKPCARDIIASRAPSYSDLFIIFDSVRKV